MTKQEIIEKLFFLHEDYLAEIETYDGGGGFWLHKRVTKLTDQLVLAKELSLQREGIKERAEKVVKELGLPKDYLDFMSAVFYVKLPSETKITKQDKDAIKSIKEKEE